ncbi:hypothetical protein CRYUN_Cryun23aG0076500 [Craigia yunnanensis]
MDAELTSIGLGKFRRQPFDWELQQWNDFMSILKDYLVCNNWKNTLIWKGSSSGEYSVKCFCKSVMSVAHQKCEYWKFVWSSLAPLKVEIFYWQLMKGKIAVKAELAKRGMMD